MKSETRDGSRERRVLTAMIVDKRVLAQVANRWTPDGLFRSKFANLIGGWCVDHYQAYKDAPGKLIDAVYESWAADAPDDDLVKLVDRFLSALGDEHKLLAQEGNSEFYVDLAAKHFNEVGPAKLAERIQGAIAEGKPAKAEEFIQKYRGIELGKGALIDVFNDKEGLIDDLEHVQEVLVQYQGDHGKFWGDELCRDAFIGISAPSKRGKSWEIMDLCCDAAEQRRRTAYFVVGDMSRAQVRARLAARYAGRPLKPRTVRIPTEMVMNEGDPFPTVSYEEKTWDDRLLWQDAWKGMQDALRSRIRSSQPYLYLSVHPGDSINIKQVRAMLQQLADGGWVPDFVGIDYLDVLAPYGHNMGDLQNIDKTWIAARAISQEFHCCVVGGTQTNAASFGAETLDKTHFSGNKLKHAHVTGMVGLNQTKAEKDMQVWRKNWMDLRGDEFSVGRCLWSAQCLAISQPNLLSCY